MSAKKRYGRYLLVYTILFAAVCLAVFLPYLTQGKSLIGNGDGQSQYILHLRYMGEWLRKTIRGFLKGDFHPDRFDYTIGMGDDIDAVVRFHPLDFLSVFFPTAKTALLYDMLTVLRCYLAGLGISAYLFHFRLDGYSALSAAMLYIFCGFTFGLGVVHPTYMSHMILFPLMLLGAEYMMDPERKRGPLLLTVTVALGFISNYYFMYISSFGLLGYVLIRFFAICRTQRTKNFFRLLAAMSLAYLTGLAISGIFLFPAIARYGSSMRAVRNVERNSLLFYSDKRRYLAWFLNLITPLEASGNGTHLNFAVTLFPALMLVFLSKRRRFLRQLRRGFLALLFCLLIPGAGYVLAAFNNENNRWVYLISFAAAAAVGFTADMAVSLTKRERQSLLLLTLVFDGGCLVWFLLSKDAYFHMMAAGELTALCAALVCLSRSREKEGRREGAAVCLPAAFRAKRCSFLSQKVVLLFTVLSVAAGGYVTFAPGFGGLAEHYENRGTAFRRYAQSSYSVFRNVPEYSGMNGAGAFENGFYRVDAVRKNYWEDNSSLLLKQPGIQAYNSILNADQLRALIDQDSIGVTSILHIHNLDGRTVQEELAGVKYLAVDSSNTASKPWGYAKEATASKGKLDLYENEYPLSFGFLTDTLIAGSDYSRLSTAAGDLVMLRAAVVDDGPLTETAETEGTVPSAETAETEGAVAETDGSASDSVAAEDGSSSEEGGLLRTDGLAEESAVLTVEPEYKVGKTISQDGTTLTTGSKKGTISLSFERKPGYECWLSMEGMRFLDTDSLSVYIQVLAKGVRKSVLLSAKNNSYSRGADDYVVNLGSTPSGEDGGKASTRKLKIVIPAGTSVSLEKLRICYLPLEGYEGKVERLNKYAMKDVVFSGDTVTGSADLEQEGFMVFQIPCGKGWSAEVNGEKADLVRADLCYMGLKLEEGHSQIKLTYRTPALREGKLSSLAGLACLLLLVLFGAGRRKAKLIKDKISRENRINLSE